MRSLFKVGLFSTLIAFSLAAAEDPQGQCCGDGLPRTLEEVTIPAETQSAEPEAAAPSAPEASAPDAEAQQSEAVTPELSPEVLIEVPEAEVQTTVVGKDSISEADPAPDAASPANTPDPMATNFMLVDDHCSVNTAHAIDANILGTLGSLMRYRCSATKGSGKAVCEVTAQDSKTTFDGKSSKTMEFTVEETAGTLLLSFETNHHISIVDQYFSYSGVYYVPASGSFVSKLCIGRMEPLETL